MNTAGKTCRAAIGMALLCFAGCAGVGARQAQIASAGGLYDQATITYRVDGGAMGVPASAPHGAVPVSYNAPDATQLTNNGLPKDVVSVLSIRYPHPEGRPGYALVEVVLEEKEPTEQPAAEKPTYATWLKSVGSAAQSILPGMRFSEGVREAWALDLPKAELDQLLAELAAAGYFKRDLINAGDAELNANLDGARVTKSWRQEPSLNALVIRARREGQLVACVQPPSTGLKVEAQPTKSLAYRDLIRQEMAGPAAPEQQPQQQFMPPQPVATQPVASAPSPVVPASAHTPAITRLPPVEDHFYR